MQDRFQVRSDYGRVFTTDFNDFVVPWRLLTLDEYLLYQRDNQRGFIPPAILEDEIFKTCVVDPTFVRGMSSLRAGVITTVVTNIWERSAALSLDQWNFDLEASRAQLFAPGASVIHQLVQIITLAFPYKPEEVYAMDYRILLQRAALAEKKLLDMGMLQEPINFAPLQERPQRAQRKQQPRHVDAKRLWEKQQKPAKKSQDVTPKEKWWAKSPVLEAKNKEKIDFDLEGRETNVFVPSGHDKMDLHINTHKMIEDAQVIYKDLIEELNRKQQGGS